MDHLPRQPLLATADAALADELARLSAAAGAAVEVASGAPEALGAWSTAPVVLAGADLVSALVDLAPPRRPGVQVVAWSPVPTGTFRDALLIGAERVVELPVGAELIAELLTDLEEVGRGEGVLVGVVGGSGGADLELGVRVGARVMRRRLFRRVAACGAVIGGVSGIVANLALMGFFALSRPWQPATQWAWLGPANDVTGAVSTAALIPVVIYLHRVLPRNRLLTVFGTAGILGMAGLTVVAPLMLSGVVTLMVQFVVAGVALPAMFGWLLVVNRVGRREGVFPVALANFGERVGVAALVATGIAGMALVVPPGRYRRTCCSGSPPLSACRRTWHFRSGRSGSHAPSSPTPP